MHDRHVLPESVVLYPGTLIWVKLISQQLLRMCSFLVLMTSCKLAHCLLQTPLLPPNHPCGDSSWQLHSQNGISLDVLFPLPFNKCFGCASSAFINLPKIIIEHYSVSALEAELWTRKARLLFTGCFHFSAGRAHKNQES